MGLEGVKKIKEEGQRGAGVKELVGDRAEDKVGAGQERGWEGVGERSVIGLR